jgi:hypothetical protein
MSELQKLNKIKNYQRVGIAIRFGMRSGCAAGNCEEWYTYNFDEIFFKSSYLNDIHAEFRQLFQ